MIPASRRAMRPSGANSHLGKPPLDLLNTRWNADGPRDLLTDVAGLRIRPNTVELADRAPANEATLAAVRTTRDIIYDTVVHGSHDALDTVLGHGRIRRSRADSGTTDTPEVPAPARLPGRPPHSWICSRRARTASTNAPTRTVCCSSTTHQRTAPAAGTRWRPAVTAPRSRATTRKENERPTTTAGRYSPPRTRNVEFGAQRTPDLAGIHSRLDRRGTGSTTERLDDMVGEQGIAASDSELGVQQLLELGQAHRATILATPPARTSRTPECPNRAAEAVPGPASARTHRRTDPMADLDGIGDLSRARRRSPRRLGEARFRQHP